SKELDNTGYPLLVISYTDLHDSNLHISQIVITLASKTWALANDLDLPMDHTEVDLMCCGILNGAVGVFVIHTTNDIPLVMFIDINTQKPSEPAWAPNVTAMATFTNPDGYSDLLVSTPGGLRHLHLELQGDKLVWRFLTDVPSFASCKELRVAQTGAYISVWAENDSNDILYQQFDLTMTKQLTPVVPLITREQGGGAFAVYLDPDTDSQNLFVVDDKSQLTRLTQDPKTRLWQHLPILVPSTGLTEDFTSFTSHINVADSNGNVLAASTVLLCSSSPTDLAVNGEPLTVGPDGVPVLTDSRGNLTIIHRVHDIASVVLTIQDAPGTVVLGQTYTLNPAKKVQDGLAKVTDAASLKSVTLPDGSKLLDGTPATSDMIAQAGTAIGQLHKHMLSLPRNGSLQSASLNRVSTKNVEASSDNTLWDFWHWLEDEAESIVTYAVNAVDDAAHWVITTAKGIFNFLLDSVTHVLKAMSWVLRQVVTGIEKIIQWVGFLFEWEDILSTHNSFVSVVNSLFDLAPTAFAKMEKNVDGWFDQLKENLQNLDVTDPNLTRTYDPTSTSKIEGDTGPINAAINTPGSNWTNYQLEHGGLGKSLAASGKSASDEGDSDDPFSDIWEKIVEPAWKDMKADLSKVLNDLAVFTSDSKSFSLANVFTNVSTHLAATMLDALKNIVTGFLRLTEMIISTVRTSINTPLNIPLLSPLYKTITKGRDLTILDAISLLVAVPTTVICKILTGKKPSELPATSMPKNEDGMSLGPKRNLGDNALSEGTSEEPMDKINTIIDVIRQILPIASLAINMVCLWWGTIGWVDPSSSMWGAIAGFVISLFAWIFSVPDCSAKRPGLQCRIDNWILGFLLLLGRLIPLEEAQGVLGILVATIQLIPISVSILLDIAAKPDDYPNGTVGSITANSIDRIVAQLAKIFSNMCLVTQGTEVQPVFMVVAMLAALIKQHTQALKLVLPEKECVGLHGF
ncbi:hypothetical protein BG006_011391, partial [Podila minutissima]